MSSQTNRMEKAARLLNSRPATAARNAAARQAQAKRRVILSNAAYELMKAQGKLPPGAVSVRQLQEQLHGPSNALAVSAYNRAEAVAPVQTLATRQTAPDRTQTRKATAPTKPRTLAQRIRALSPAAKERLRQTLAALRTKEAAV